MSAPSSQSFAAVIERSAPGLALVEEAMRGQLASPSPVVRSLGEHVLAGGRAVAGCG